jgi:hypothetical protein
MSARNGDGAGRLRPFCFLGKRTPTIAAEEKNAENLLVIKSDGELMKKYLANFNIHLVNVALGFTRRRGK